MGENSDEMTILHWPHFPIFSQSIRGKRR